ncbi:hypothetical protein DYB32_004031 [Aphanomyces invadans]|uniref:Uncharacterized protein n=1 Tax=Aphanomyces invadans TaxID=157072 RepID=A0A3R6Z068_9STRA|nr:hypothetical protein DYB32_004031 [Aphanomyces invadans]
MKGVSNYMDAVRTAFVKNFDKFELYMLRNVFVAPDNIAEIQTAAHAHEHAQSTDSDQWNDANPADVEAELHALRQEFFRATETQRSLLAAKNAVDQQVGDVHAFVADLSFTKDIPKKGTQRTSSSLFPTCLVKLGRLASMSNLLSSSASPLAP